jgi:hypothetical protein
MSCSTSDYKSSTIYNVSEPDILDAQISIPFQQWVATPRREGAYSAGQSTAERTKEYLREINFIISWLQGSGFPIHAIEPQVHPSSRLDLCDIS